MSNLTYYLVSSSTLFFLALYAAIFARTKHLIATTVTSTSSSHSDNSISTVIRDCANITISWAVGFYALLFWQSWTALSEVVNRKKPDSDSSEDAKPGPKLKTTTETSNTTKSDSESKKDSEGSEGAGQGAGVGAGSGSQGSSRYAASRNASSSSSSSTSTSTSTCSSSSSSNSRVGARLSRCRSAVSTWTACAQPVSHVAASA